MAEQPLCRFTGEIIGVGLLSRILRDCDLTRQDLIDLCGS